MKSERNVREFASLTRRGQLGRLRQLGRHALVGYGIDDAHLRPLGYAENATFRVETPDGRYVLRMNRPHVHAAETVASEMAWLAALRRDTDIEITEPVTALDGSFVTSVWIDSVPEPRLCVLLRWLEGRFVDRNLAPSHLTRVGELIATLHNHAASWIPPPSFQRPRVGTLTDTAKAQAFSTADAALTGEHPSYEDGQRALAVVESCLSTADAILVADVLEIIRATARDLARRPGSFGLVHGDLHYQNFLFHQSRVRAIDFDDCGWAFDVYDLAVTLSELEGRERYDELRDALLAGYAGHRTLSEDDVTHIKVLTLLRVVQILVWIIESRERASFREHWHRWAGEELDWLRGAVKAQSW